MVVKERELRDALERLKQPPALVGTDSRAFLKAAADTPPAVPMTSFSILFARAEGGLNEFARGAGGVADRVRHGETDRQPCPLPRVSSGRATTPSLGYGRSPCWEALHHTRFENPSNCCRRWR